MNTGRFTFPGFVPVRQADTSTHEVEIGKINLNDEVFIVHMIRKSGLSFEGSFLAAKIFDHTEKTCMWQFPKDSFVGLGLLAQAGSEIVVALVGNGREGKVEEIIPLSSITSHRPTNIRRRIELKRLAADYLGRNYNLSLSERAIVKHDGTRRQEEERAKREREYETRQKAREELITRIMGRGQVEAYTSDGRKRFGLPVLSSEWPSLSHNTYVVLVESYDEASCEMGNPIEAFQIVKEKGQNPKKGSPAPVTWEKPTDVVRTTTISGPTPICSVIIETENGDAFEVAVYATMDDIRKARAGGLNSGTYVAARDKKVGERYEVFSVRKEGVSTIGMFKPIA